MKTLILNGFPRINGESDSLIKKITSKKIDEYKIVNAYRGNISYAPSVVAEHINRLLPENTFEFIITSSNFMFRKNI